MPNLPPKVNINFTCLNTIDVMNWKKVDSEKKQLGSYASIYHTDFLLVDLQMIFISFYVFSSNSHILQCIFEGEKGYIKCYISNKKNSLSGNTHSF